MAQFGVTCALIACVVVAVSGQDFELAGNNKDVAIVKENSEAAFKALTNVAGKAEEAVNKQHAKQYAVYMKFHPGSKPPSRKEVLKNSGHTDDGNYGTIYKVHVAASKAESPTIGSRRRRVCLIPPCSPCLFPPCVPTPTPTPTPTLPPIVVPPTPEPPLQCKVDVEACFAHRAPIPSPSWSSPVDQWAESYDTICAPEKKVKKAAQENKLKEEMNSKELCSKNEKNSKYSERKFKLAQKKEKYSKTVAEGQDKFLEKKIKSAQEGAIKTVGMSKEKSEKSAERASKREDELYKKECASKETSFKAVREARTKVKVVYVNYKLQTTMPAIPAPAVAAAPGKIVKTVTVVKPAPAPAPVVDKTTVYVPAPVTRTVIEHKVHHERQFKSKEVSEKTNAQSGEMLAKELAREKEAVGKEATHKQSHDVVLHKSNEGACKEKDSKEFSHKSEIKVKLAVEKVRKEIASKEANSKVIKVVKKKPCNPESALETYVKHCKNTEEKLHKAKTIGEQQIKEAKVKSETRFENHKCKLAFKLCRMIFKHSMIRDSEISAMVTDHTRKMQEAYAKAELKRADLAAADKFHICESAASDIRYFGSRFFATHTLFEAAPSQP